MQHKEQIMEILPHRPPMLLVDESVEMDEEHVIGLLHLTGDEFFFQGHFPGNPIMPAVFRLAALAQAGGVPITVRTCREDGNGSIVCETDEDASVVGVTQKKSGRSRLAAITAVGGALPSIEKEKIAVTALERAEITVFAVAAGERFMSFYVLRDDAERALQLVHDALIAAKE